MDLEIDLAQPSDSAELTALAHAAKRHWGYPESWIEAWRDDLTLTPDFIAGCEAVYGGRRAGAWVGCGVLSREGDRWSIEHMWIHPSAMGLGLGRRLFERLAETARGRGAMALEVLSDPNAGGFYRRLGFEPVGEWRTEILGQPRVLPILRLGMS
ncbi:MAG: GNAT family N-acetyltransferase [Acidobacteriota bacterium]